MIARKPVVIVLRVVVRNMKLVPAFVALAVLGWLGVLLSGQMGEETRNPPPAQQRKEALVSFKLRVSGREGNCTVVKRGMRDSQRAELKLDENCFRMLPRLTEARFWQQGTSGEVTFAAADGRPIVKFFAADGVAYESLYPVTPLVALTAQ